MLDGVGLAEKIARGELTAAEAFDDAQRRMDTLDPLLGAVVTRVRERPRATKGPLSGVPMLVKDSLPWPGQRWSMGARALAHNVASMGTPLGDALVRAGLVCVGKTAMSELGLLASTETLLEGATHDPWSLARSAGGSSGGSAAAVAAGLVPIAHASDGGGSIRVPAALCGVFGFKPSRGRTVSASLVQNDFAEMTGDHVITRTVRDSALVCSLTEDPAHGAPIGYVRGPSSKRLRLAAFSETMLGRAPAPEIAAAFERTIALLEGLGHHVERIAAPAYAREELTEAFFLVAGSAASALVQGLDARRGTPVQEDELEPFTWALIEAFEAFGPRALPTARARFAEASARYREATHGFDAVLTPTLADVSVPLGHLSPLLPRDELVRRTGALNGYAPIANVVGCPAMTVPLETSADGLPIGLHFLAPIGEDARLFALAYELEAARPWRDRWPPFSVPALARARS